MSYFIQQSLAQTGFTKHPYLNAEEYLERLASSMNGKIIETTPTTPPTLILNAVLELYISLLLAGVKPPISSTIALLETPRGHVAAWITTYGGVLPGFNIFTWYAHVITLEGSGAYGPEKLVDLLVSLTIHTNVSMEWLKVLRQRSQQMTRQAIRNIRAQSRMWENIRNSIRSTSLPIYHSNYTSSAEESSLANAFSHTWDEYGGASSGDSYEGESGSRLSDYDWASGQGTFYVDSDGMIRSVDYGEEVVAEEMDSDGTLYDSEGNVIGRVEEGYVYEEGSRVGRLDTGISDEWQLERYEQAMGDADRILGRDMFGANYDEESDYTPYYVTRMRRERDEDEL